MGLAPATSGIYRDSPSDWPEVTSTEGRVPEDRTHRHAALAGHTGDEKTARAALTDARPAVRATALGALARMHKLTDDDVSAGLADDAPAVRRRSCELAVLMDLDLIPSLHDVDNMVVEAAAWALGERADRAGA